MNKEETESIKTVFKVPTWRLLGSPPAPGLLALAELARQSPS